MRRWLLAALLLVPAAAAAAGSGRGTEAAAFLTLSPGARASSLGGALGGVADDALAAHYNPAGLGSLDLVEAAAGRESRFEGMSYDWAAIAVPVLAWVDSPRRASAAGTAALSVYSLSTSGIERRGLVETDEPTGSFKASDRAYALSYGVRLPESPLLLGATAKLIESSLDASRGSAFSADAGALWKAERWSAGAGARNAFGRLRLGSSSDPLPMALYAGGGWRPAPGWLAAAEYARSRDGGASLGLGGEHRRELARGVSGAARAGWRSDRADQGAWAGMSIGLGLSFKAMDVDMAWSPGGVLGDVLQYSLRVRF